MDTQHILVPVDFSDSSKQALRHADVLASERHGNLLLFHVHPIVEMAVLDFTYVQPPDKVAEVCEMLEQRLEEWARTLKTPVANIKVQIVTGSPPLEIINKSKDCDIIVMATHGRSTLSHFLMGSTTERVVQGAHCSVLVVKDKAMTSKRALQHDKAS